MRGAKKILSLQMLGFMAEKCHFDLFLSFSLGGGGTNATIVKRQEGKKRGEGQI